MVPLLIAGAALAQPRFEDVSALAPPLAGAHGIAVGDVDNDGWPDLFVTGDGGRAALLLNEAGARWSDRSRRLPFEIGAGVGNGVFGDMDDDGDLDLFVPLHERSALLRNDRGDFRDITAPAGLPQGPVGISLWLDADRDGRMDLLLATGQRLQLARGLGGGRFDSKFLLAADGPGTVVGGAGADVDADGWPDLVLSVAGGADRLLLGGDAGFRHRPDAGLMADVGPAGDLVLADVDGDGDVDLFRTAGPNQAARLLVNDGDGAFHLAADGPNDASGAAFLDLDDDGDVDLVTVGPTVVLTNAGDGTFTSQGKMGLAAGGTPVVVLDIDLDGAQDLVFGGAGRGLQLYRNRGGRGDPHHRLRVVPVGDRSARSGVGARVDLQTAGGVQTRQITAAVAGRQGESLAHFGLGEDGSPERLQVHWPSGRTDAVASPPIDATIYVYEGRTIYSYFPMAPSSWQLDLPDTLMAGRPVELRLTVNPSLEEPKSGIDRVVADLSALGGDPAVPLPAVGGGVYAAELSLRVDRPGLHEIRVAIDQSTVVGHPWIELSRLVAVRPEAAARDMVILGDRVHPDWQARVRGGAALPVYSTGSTTIAVEPNASAGPSGWSVGWRTDAPVDPLSYRSVHLVLRLGDNTPDAALRLWVDNRAVDLLSGRYSLDPERSDWQTVDVPLSALRLAAPIRALGLAGTLRGTLHVESFRLVTGDQPTTAVALTPAATPDDVLLHAAYPNPANAAFVIPFQLPEPGPVDLSLYDLAGQRLATLLSGTRPAGAHAVTWDGTDQIGRLVATGVYLVRLRAGGVDRTRKLTLIR